MKRPAASLGRKTGPRAELVHGQKPRTTHTSASNQIQGYGYRLILEASNNTRTRIVAYVRRNRIDRAYHVVVLDDPVDGAYLVDEVGAHELAGLLALERVAGAVEVEVEVVAGRGRRGQDPDATGRVHCEPSQQSHGDSSAHCSQLRHTYTRLGARLTTE